MISTDLLSWLLVPMGLGGQATNLMLNLFAVILLGWGSGRLAARLGYPPILGELAAGVVFGPPLLGLVRAQPELEVLAELGIFVMMLYVGMMIDPRELGKAAWSSVLVATGGFAFPFVAGYCVVQLFGNGLTQGVGEPWQAGLVVGLTAACTSVAIKSRILMDLKLLETRLAYVLMGATLLTDTATLLVFSVLFAAFTAGPVEYGQLAWLAVKALGFLAAAALAGVYLMPLVAKVLTRGRLGPRTTSFTLVLLVALLFGGAAHAAGLHALLGSFLAGVFLREGVIEARQAREVEELVRDLSVGFLAPVFFVLAGFSFSFEVFSTSLGAVLAVTLVATVSKLFGTALAYLPSRNGWREGLVAGAAMNGHGAVEVLVANAFLASGHIGTDVFSTIIFMTFATTAIVPSLLQRGTAWLKRRGELVMSETARSGHVIVGAGPLARLVGRELTGGGPVTLVDTNRQRCERARAEGLVAVDGSALQAEVLSAAGAARSAWLLAVTSNAEVNLLAAGLARDTFLVPRIAVAVAEAGSPALSAGPRATAFDALFAKPVQISDWEVWIMRGEVERTELVVREDVSAAAFAVGLGDGVPMLPLVVRKGGEWLPVHGHLPLSARDPVIALRRRPPVQEREAVFAELVRGSPVIDLPRVSSADAFLKSVAEPLAQVTDLDPAGIAGDLARREAESSAVLTAGVAIPHLRLSKPGELHLLIARVREGVLLSAKEPPVHAVFVLVSSQDTRNQHLKALSEIARLVSDPDFMRRWQSARGSEGLRRLVLSRVSRPAS